MSLKTVGKFEVQRLEILDTPDEAKFKIAEDVLLKIYRTMVEIRAYDYRAVLLQRQGRLGTYPVILGQEASQVIPALCLKPQDWMVPTYRGQGAYYARGMQMRYSLLYWAGDDRGVRYPEGNNDMIFSIPVGTHLTQVAGLAWAEKLKGTKNIGLTYLGDGTSSKGDLHEALTFAGQFKLPCVYVIENNQWAISVPRKKQARTDTLAQKAWGYGVRGLQVDGNDALAVYQAATEAIAAARKGETTLLECETYRMGNHTTADDAARYRDAKEVEKWKAKDPVERLRKYMVKKKLWDDKKEKALLSEVEAAVQTEVDAYEAFEAPNPLNMFADQYEKAPWHLIEQHAEMERYLEVKKEKEPTMSLPPVEGRFP
jgi:pyruvate dehydrogenase E1 component alpha subunit